VSGCSYEAGLAKNFHQLVSARSGVNYGSNRGLKGLRYLVDPVRCSRACVGRALRASIGRSRAFGGRSRTSWALGVKFGRQIWDFHGHCTGYARVSHPPSARVVTGPRATKVSVSERLWEGEECMSLHDTRRH
jgi:hypothetical protein